MQKQYWSRMTQYKFDLCYYDSYFARCVKIDRFLKIGLAVASSSAIAAWTAWQNLSFLWGLIIVVSQVVSSLNEFLPYKKRIEDLSKLVNGLTPIYNDMEEEWLYVANGSLTEDQINDRCYKFIRKWDQITRNTFLGDSMPDIKKCRDKAEKMKDDYFRNTF